MKIRLFGIFIGGVFAICGAIIGQGFTDAYLRLPFFHELPVERYHTEAAISLIFVGGLIGFLVGSILFRHFAAIVTNLKDIPVEDKIAWMVGTVVSMLPAFMLAIVVLSLGMGPAVTLALIIMESTLVLWLGNAIGLSMKEQLNFLVRGADQSQGKRPAEFTTASADLFKLLDASAIIDGRIYDIIRCGFLNGQIFIPAFVIKEIQHLAEAPDPLRRNRGRRGLDFLRKMQDELFPTPEIIDQYKTAFTSGDAIYTKLVKLAKEIGHTGIVTCDYNLLKVAKTFDVTVMNINELAAALKPALLPGEELTVTIVREGKEANEGIGYLEDGSMVVIRDGRRKMDTQVVVTVVSVTHTAAGKMIFTDLKEDAHNHRAA